VDYTLITGINKNSMEEIITNIHIHTQYSDGKKTHKEIAADAVTSGVDAIIITDHNLYIKGLDGYYPSDGKKVLVIIGEEIHDKNRIPQKNHMLALGIRESYAKYANSSQALIDSISTAGGLTFIAHPYDPELKIFNEQDLSWEDWSVTGFTGLELWNNLSEFKMRVRNHYQALFYIFFPAFLAKEPHRKTLALWDSLLSKNKKIVAIGGADAHMLETRIGPLKKYLYPYTYHFRTINTHLLVEKKLSGTAEKDIAMILVALKEGHAFVANDSIHSARGFRFNAAAKDHFYNIGDEFSFQDGIILNAILPAEAECILIKDGKSVFHEQKCRDFSYSIDSPGCYRLECYKNYLFEKRGWIFSNPIYIR
jgi:hypothetical protein